MINTTTKKKLTHIRRCVFLHFARVLQWFRVVFRISRGGGWLSIGVFALLENVRFMVVSCLILRFFRGCGFAAFRHLPT